MKNHVDRKTQMMFCPITIVWCIWMKLKFHFKWAIEQQRINWWRFGTATLSNQVYFFLFWNIFIKCASVGENMKTIIEWTTEHIINIRSSRINFFMRKLKLKIMSLTCFEMRKECFVEKSLFFVIFRTSSAAWKNKKNR